MGGERGICHCHCIVLERDKEEVSGEVYTWKSARDIHIALLKSKQMALLLSFDNKDEIYMIPRDMEREFVPYLLVLPKILSL